MNKADQTDKLTRVLEATEHPELYTDEELEQLLSDEECAEYYHLMCEAASAYDELREEDTPAIEISHSFIGILLWELFCNKTATLGHSAFPETFSSFSFSSTGPAVVMSPSA